jgi:hypothetical protein
MQRDTPRGYSHASAHSEALDVSRELIVLPIAR